MAMARLLLATIIALLALYPSLSHAQCIPGLPCDVGLTPNDPKKDDDGPNKEGAPNEPKRGSSDACDSDFMNQIYAKAYIEAERQNVMGGFLIRKPDSVLEYSCFNQMASRVATITAPIFTETREWINKPVFIWGEINKTDIDKSEPVIGKVADLLPVVTAGKAKVPVQQYPVIINEVFMGDLRVDRSIQEVVIKSLRTYLDRNYAHTFIGGTIGLDYPEGGEFDGGEYDCHLMERVHQYAKCMNFNAPDPDQYKDKFFQFEELATTDPRLLPDPCGGRPPILGGLDTLEIAKNTNFHYAAFDKDSNIYDNLINPKSCEPGIKTGITLQFTDRNVDSITSNVNLGAPKIYDDLVCPNLGCSIQKDSWECK